MLSVHPPTNGVQHEEPLCRAFINQSSVGNGTLFISESDVKWIQQDNTGMLLHYKDIAVHAISTDQQAFSEHCLYVMYNGEILNSTDSSDEDDDNPVTEIRFVPADRGHLKDMFNAMSDCQCLHPDEEDSDYAPEDALEFADGAAGEGFFTAAEGFEHLTPQGLATLQRLEGMLDQESAARGDNLESAVNGLHLNGNADDDQFEDAQN